MEALLKRLKLARVREIYRERIDQAAAEDWGYHQFLQRLLEEEVLARQANRLNRRKQQAGFPFEKGLELIQQKLGHASPSVTRRYIGITADEIEQVENNVVL